MNRLSILDYANFAFIIIIEKILQLLYAWPREVREIKHNMIIV